ncbi:amidase signature domain-containing protein [Lasiosphaeria hispida]|uniref:Amidase signature domain-containing protein n=1 Tax=Lasiosphaeria hispida TaxID=260671 RepID=A0AAJ0HBD1_9PEZI|nr:amidase signature domain-containing protein [Lasiosphaeria hispida]
MDGSESSFLPDLINATADELCFGLQSEHFTSLQLVRAYIRRSQQVQETLHAVLELNPDAESIAASLDSERQQGQVRGSLHGLPVMLKGNIGTRDDMQTTAGSFALHGARLPADSTVAAKLRDQGLILLGKTSLTEWSMFRANNWPHAWNPISGQIYGAYCAKQCPGGSSGGSAVAADLGLCWAALGTETDGSIILPCERNNIVGIKPTVGLTSRFLVVPVSEHQDTVGPMARTVKDAAQLLQVIAGPDPNDRYTTMSPPLPPTNNTNSGSKYMVACKLSGLEGKRIGIARNVLEMSQSEVSNVVSAFHDAISVMRSAGATIVDNANFTAYADWKKRKFNPVTRADFATNLPEFLTRLEHNPNDIHSVRDLRIFTQETRPVEEGYPQRNTRVWDYIIETDIDNKSAEFEALYRENLYLGGEGGVLGALARHGLHAIALPTTVASSIPALVGSPIVTVPLGCMPADTPVETETAGDAVERAPGIPCGISFLGPKWSEETLIEIAYAFEQKTRARSTLQRHVEPTF